MSTAAAPHPPFQLEWPFLRDPRHHMFGGVLSGIAQTLHVNRQLVRLLYVAGAIYLQSWWFVAAYFILMALLPFRDLTPQPENYEYDYLVNADQRRKKFPAQPRSQANWIVRGTMIGLGFVGFFTLDQIQFVAAAAAGFIVALIVQIHAGEGKKLLLPAVTFVLLGLMLGAIGEPLESVYQYKPAIITATDIDNPAFVYGTIDRYVGGVVLNAAPSLDTGFAFGQETIRVQAPNNARVELDTRMAAGQVVVQQHAPVGNGEVMQTQQLLQKAGAGASVKQTFGEGELTIPIKVRGGAGRIVVVIDRTEYALPAAAAS